MMKTMRTILLAITAACLISACSMLGVKPWQRGVMARKSMQLNVQPEVTAFHDHIYFSKEGSSGGRTFDGGGCGCN